MCSTWCTPEMQKPRAPSAPSSASTRIASARKRYCESGRTPASRCEEPAGPPPKGRAGSLLPGVQTRPRELTTRHREVVVTVSGSTHRQLAAGPGDTPDGERTTVEVEASPTIDLLGRPVANRSGGAEVSAVAPERDRVGAGRTGARCVERRRDIPRLR